MNIQENPKIKNNMEGTFKIGKCCEASIIKSVCGIGLRIDLQTNKVEWKI